ncbi:MAG TPA: anhydro-N-acetylmuramic acid kinase [Burkholderiaceae bacterium]|jgi:anhydro-N-acetylmuramic acid kinase|nr:anhydro-N-acetylmuramic acid kinase [Burkholderiaceae bacterium]
MTLFVGLMSGTSLDGVDGVLVEFSPALRVFAHEHQPFPGALRSELLALNSAGDNELHRTALAGQALAVVYAEVIDALLVGVDRTAVRAVGAHGQTVRHRPQDGYTSQLLNGALLAERCGIDVVCDFRSRDVAASGQGAPLVPAFHQALFARRDAEVAVLNLGGIANLTLLPPGSPVLGFDCGPANVLMDLWCERHRGEPFDRDGAWAAQGSVDSALLASLQAEPFFAAPPPKSTGRDLFHAGWLDARVGSTAAADVQATLAELTAWSVAEDLRRHAPGASELLVCGGGALNGHLMRRLRERLPGLSVAPTDARGLPALQVEACAFAWLAQAFVERRAGNLPAVTGARGPRVLGALYPG